MKQINNKVLNYICSFDETNYELDKYCEKSKYLNMLKARKPVKINKIKTRGSYWKISCSSLFHFAVNKSFVEIDETTDSVCDFYSFLENLAFYDNKALACGFENDGLDLLISAIPVDKTNIRFSIYRYHSIEEDFIINKYNFIKQINSVIKRCRKILEKNTEAETEAELHFKSHHLKHSADYIKIFNNYLKNPEKFKRTHKLPYHLTLFDIAYKKPDSDWQFTYCFEDDEKSSVQYWKNLQNEGKIQYFDICRQYILMNKSFYYYTNYEHYPSKPPEIRYYEKKEDIIYSPDMDRRMGLWHKDWIYSEQTKKWYSKDEILPMPSLKPVVLENFNLNLTFGRIKWSDIKSYIKQDKIRRSLYCQITIQKGCFNERYVFKYCILTEKFLKKLENGGKVNLSERREKAYVWNDEKDYFYFYNKKNDKTLFVKIRKDEFIAKFRNELNRICRDINFLNSKSDLLKQEKDDVAIAENNNCLLGEVKNKNTEKYILSYLKQSSPQKAEKPLINNFLFAREEIFCFTINNIISVNIPHRIFHKASIKYFLEKIITLEKPIIWLYFNESQMLNFIVVPIDKKNIRFVINDEYELYQDYYNSGIEYKFKDIPIICDFITDKKQLIKDFNEQFKKLLQDDKACMSNVTKRVLSVIVPNFDKYIKSKRY